MDYALAFKGKLFHLFLRAALERIKALETFHLPWFYLPMKQTIQHSVKRQEKEHEINALENIF